MASVSGFGQAKPERAAAEAGDQPDYALSRRDAFIDGTGSAVVHYSDVLSARARPIITNDLLVAYMEPGGESPAYSLPSD